MPEWFDDDTFWRIGAPAMFSAARWEATPAEIDGVLARVGSDQPGAALDMPCGPGRHGLELARRGWQVVGVDRYGPYLEHARCRADGEGLGGEWLQSDMRDFSRPDAFDLVLNLFGSFGYFVDGADDRRLARNFFDSLRPGGCLIMDLMGKEVLARIFRSRDWHELEDGTLWLEERKIVGSWGSITGRWLFVTPTGGRHDFRYRLRLYTAAELSALLQGVGFVSVEAFGDLQGSPYDEQATRLVVVARKGA